MDDWLRTAAALPPRRVTNRTGGADGPEYRTGHDGLKYRKKDAIFYQRGEETFGPESFILLTSLSINISYVMRQMVMSAASRRCAGFTFLIELYHRL